MAQAVPYIRFSSSRQEKGDSLKRQNELIDSYLIANPDVTLSNMRFEDLGLSGFHGDHLENDFGKLQAAVQSGHIKAGDYILVEAMDRLGRLEEIKMINILTGILDHNVKIVTLEDNQEYSREAMSKNPALGYILWGKASSAYEYSKRLSRRITASYKSKREDAKAGKGVKRKTPWWVTWNDTTERYDVVTDEDSKLLTNVFEWYLAGWGENRILKKLRELQPERFGTFAASTIKRNLKNKTAIGYWGDIPNVYPAAISEALYYKVQEELKRRADGKSQAPRSGHFLCGLVKCGCCGGNYSMRSNKHSRDAMMCSKSNKDKTRCGNGKTIPVQVLDWIRYETFEDAIKQIEMNSQTQEAEEQLTVVNGQIDELSTKLDNLMDMVMGGSKIAQATATKLEAELEVLEQERDKLLLATRTPTELSYSEAVQMGSEMLEDSEKLSLLLRNVGYELVAEGHTVTFKERVFEYVKWSRVGDVYLMRELNSEGDLVEEFEIPVMRKPTAEELAELEAEPTEYTYYE